MTFLATELEEDLEPQICSVCGEPASVREDEELLCASCALRKLRGDPGEESTAHSSVSF